MRIVRYECKRSNRYLFQFFRVWFSAVAGLVRIAMAGGFVFTKDAALASFHDPRPSVASEIARLIQRHSIKSHVIMGHIRKANRGRVCLENTHPFSRELWGRTWTFAHNGQLRGIKKRRLNFYQPVGTTDSEYAFCWILDQVRKKFARRPKREERLWRFLRELSVETESYRHVQLLA